MIAAAAACCLLGGEVADEVGGTGTGMAKKKHLILSPPS